MHYSELLRLLSHLGIHLVDELLDGHGSLFATTLLTHRDEALGSFLLAYDDHVGDALQLVVANLTAELLVAVVDIGAHALLGELAEYALCVVIIFL